MQPFTQAESDPDIDTQALVLRLTIIGAVSCVIIGMAISWL